jgi:Putative Ig domain
MHFDVSPCSRPIRRWRVGRYRDYLWWGAVGLAAACVASCGTSSSGSDHTGPDAQGVDAGVDEVVDAHAPADAADEKREAVPPIVPLAFVPDSPLVYQSTTVVSLPDAELGRPYVQTLHVRAGTGVAPYHLSFSGLAATGFAAVVERNDTVDAEVIVLGVGADLGVNHLLIDLVDGSGAKVSTSFAFRVVEATATILPARPPAARAGVSGYQTTLQATGGTPPLVWSASGLPVGMSIDPAAGVLSGVPDATAGDRDVQFVVTVTDSLLDPSTHAPAGRSVSATMQMHVDPGYRVNVYATVIKSYGCPSCHADVGNSVYYKPRIAGIPTPPAGMENAGGLVGEHPGGIAGDAHPTVCLPSMTYVIPGDPDNSLLFQKIAGTLAAPPPCGSCMPYQGSCNTEPVIPAAGRDLVRHWIMSLPPMPSAKDLE